MILLASVSSSPVQRITDAGALMHHRADQMLVGVERAAPPSG